jgi:uncharacterized protein (DUF4415 family)
MSEERIVRRTRDTLPRGRTDWARVDGLSEAEVEAAARSDVDNPPWTEEELRNARLVMPEDRGKVPISIRVDAEVLDYFKEQGRGYQSRINAVLRAYVRSRREKYRP